MLKGQNWLEDGSTDIPNSFYEILDICPKLESDNNQIHVCSDESSKETEADNLKEKNEKYIKFLEEQEILHFLENKSPLVDQNIQFSTEFENFDEFLYYYKSFHSPLIDKEFDGFSLEQIKTETRKNEEKKNEQLKNRRIWDKLQVMKDTQAITAWREKYKDLKKSKEKEFDYDDVDIDLDPPFATDPDWSLATTKTADQVFSLANNDAKLEDVVNATVALEIEFDKEIQKVLKSTANPGKLGETKLRARSARIGRLDKKLEQVKRKGNTLSGIGK